MNSHPQRHPLQNPPAKSLRVRAGLLTAALVALVASQAGCVVRPTRTVYVVQEAPPPPATVVVEAGADTTVVVDDFYEPLSNYGVWVYAPPYGRVWQPASDMAGPGFTPYGSRGHWVLNDDGDWMFVSAYHAQWGWATYHYGRWAWTDYYGWVWVPGTAWAPSWVEWRYGGGYVGWVPMGPPGYVVVEEHWVFVAETHVGAETVLDHRLPPDSARTAYVAASPIIEVKGGAKWKAGPPSHQLLNSGVQITTAHVAAPPAGYVRTQARLVNDAAADRRASGQLVTAPQVRPGATVPPGAAVAERPRQLPGSQGASPGGQPISPQPQGGRPDGSMPGQQPGSPMPQPVPNPNDGQRPGAMPQPLPQPMPQPTSRPMPQPQPQPMPQPQPTSRPTPQPMPQPQPQPQPRPSASPVPRPSAPPTAAPKPAPRPTATARPAPPKKRK